MWTIDFWKATGERAIKTLAQSLVALITVGVSIVEIPWGATLGISATAALVSILTSIGSNAATKDGPSLSHNETVN